MRTKGVPAVQEVGTESLVVTCGLAAGGELRFRCDPTKLAIEVTGASARFDWGLEMGWAKDKQIPVADVGNNAIRYKHQDFGYTLLCGASEVSRVGENKVRIKEARDSVIFTFDADKSTSSNDGAATGSSPSGS